MGDVDDTTRTEELTEEQKRANVVRLAFGGDPSRLDAFCEKVRQAIPEGTAAVLVGADVVGLFKMTGFFVPGVHSRPLSDEDPLIAPDLIPLRQQLIEMVGRPVNIQATRDFVMHFRGDVLGQPYLTLIEPHGDP